MKHSAFVGDVGNNLLKKTPQKDPQPLLTASDIVGDISFFARTLFYRGKLIPITNLHVGKTRMYGDRTLKPQLALMVDDSLATMKPSWSTIVSWADY